LIFQRGLFNFNDTLQTTRALNYYMVGLPFYGLYKVFSPIFYTLDKPKVPVIISIISIFFNIIFCVALVPYFGFPILALGTSLSMFLNSGLLAILLKKALNLGWDFFFNKRVGKVFFASIICFFSVDYLAQKLFDFKDIFIFKLAIFCALGLIGVFVCGVLLVMLGEYKQIKNFLR
jgi:putative peptidoglycan lipid II flippase